jgi:DUF1680 family protein
MKKLLPVALLAVAQSLSAAELNPITPKVQEFDLADVRVLESPFKTAQELDGKYLLSLDPDRLLAMFRFTAGLSNSATAYGGWESPNVELRGHSIGHYLSACALMYASTGDDQFRKRAEYLVRELAKCQEAMPSQGYHAGYLSAFPESLFDRVDAQKPVWAPWYTMHKIVAGLFDVHVLTGNQQALTVVTNLAEWVKFRVDRLTPEQMQGSLKNEHGGMNEVLANLAAVTKNPEYLRLAEAFNHKAVLDPLAQGEDKLDGLHANTQIPKVIGAAREYELTGDHSYRRIAEFFWERVALHRSYALGGHSDNEHFFPTNAFERHLSPVTAETCNTYNMLKLTEHLFTWLPNARAVDFYERGLYNQILASQEPERGMFAYFMSMKPGHFKTYSTPDNSFWCCVGTGMENHAKYGQMIYSHSDDSLYVNLFIPSELNWKDRGITVTQQTKFPEANTTKLTFKTEKPSQFTLRIRRPEWASDRLVAEVNGKKLELAQDEAGYAGIDREWRNGDAVSITVPMSIRTENLPGVSNTIAFFYGPILLAGEMGTNDLPGHLQEVPNQQDLVWVPAPAAPVLVGELKTIAQSLKPVSGKPLTFTTGKAGRPEAVTLTPYYRVHHERYNIHWPLYSEADWKIEAEKRAKTEAERKANERRIVDMVFAGNEQSDRDHNLRGENSTTGDSWGRSYRQSANGTPLSWTFKPVEGNAVIRVTFAGGDLRKAGFEVLVNGTKVAEQLPGNAGRGELKDLEFTVPASVTVGAKSLEVKFQPKPNSNTGRIFQCAILKAK